MQNNKFKARDFFSYSDEYEVVEQIAETCSKHSDCETPAEYLIRSNCPYLICRTCCHENIGNNTQIHPRLTFLNWANRVKNMGYSRIQKKKKGYYFSPNYSKDKYPRSKAALGLANSDELLEIARNSVDSDICRKSVI